VVGVTATLAISVVSGIASLLDLLGLVTLPGAAATTAAAAATGSSYFIIEQGRIRNLLA
jgi:hypothetical protein